MQPTLWACVAVGVIVLALTCTRLGRTLAAAAITIILVVAAYRIFIHSYSCGETACRVELAPTWAGFCIPLSGTVEHGEGRYYLTGPAGSSAVCADARFWR